MAKKVPNRSPEEMARGMKKGFRSGLEEEIGKQLDMEQIDYEYEPFRLPYIQPAQQHTYTIDFVLPNGILIESKGQFTTADRKKHLLIKEQHPELDLRFVFSNPKNKINKRSKTTYAAWCAKHGFPYAEKFIPNEWLREPLNKASWDKIQQLRK